MRKINRKYSTISDHECFDQFVHVRCFLKLTLLEMCVYLKTFLRGQLRIYTLNEHHVELKKVVVATYTVHYCTVLYRTFCPLYTKGHDSNLPAIVSINVGSKGLDSNLPAIVTVRVGSEGCDLNLSAIISISVGSKVLTQTCRP